MNTITYSNLVANRPQLAPVPVKVEGIEHPIQVHVYTISDYRQLMEKSSVGKDEETVLRIQLLYFLGGLNADVGEAAIAQLDEIFTSWQMRELYRKAITLNGQGPAALEDAAKK